MGSKTRLSSYCSKRGDNTMNLVTSHKTNARLARPIKWELPQPVHVSNLTSVTHPCLTAATCVVVMASENAVRIH